MSFEMMFASLQSPGSVILLTLLLTISIIIAWKHGHNINDIDAFLYSPGEMSSLDFGLSEAAYMIAVGTTLIFLSSLSLVYGSWFLVVAVVSWGTSILLYKKMATEGDLIDFFKNTGAHLGDYVVKKTSDRSRNESILVLLISFLIGLTFFGYFTIEIVALKIIVIEMGPIGRSIEIIVVVAFITIIYTNIGGYKGTFKTDVVQTLCISIFLIFGIIYAVNKTNELSTFTFSPFMSKSALESLGLLISYTIISFANLVTGLDIWARMRSTEGRINSAIGNNTHEKSKKGLFFAFLFTIFLFLLICFIGLIANSLNVNVEDYRIITDVVVRIGIPAGLVLVLLLVLAVSTADTAIITTIQSIEPFLRKARYNKLWIVRLIILVISITGLIFAVLIPPEFIIQAIYVVISLPVSFTSIIVIRRFSKSKSVNEIASILTIIISCIIGIIVAANYREYADYVSIIVLLLSFCLYYFFNMIIISLKSIGVMSGGNS